MAIYGEVDPGWLVGNAKLKITWSMKLLIIPGQLGE